MCSTLWYAHLQMCRQLRQLAPQRLQQPPSLRFIHAIRPIHIHAPRELVQHVSNHVNIQSAAPLPRLERGQKRRRGQEDVLDVGKDDGQSLFFERGETQERSIEDVDDELEVAVVGSLGGYELEDGLGRGSVSKWVLTE
jgi:hypothetical protein